MANNKFTTTEGNLDLTFPSLTTNSYVVTLDYDKGSAASASETTGFKATAKRNGGTLDKEVLTITVLPDGSITRNASAELRKIATTWTNTTAAAEAKAS